MTLFFLTTHILAQATFTFSGRVVNDLSEPLSGASIVLHEGQSGTTTDSNGYFRIRNLQPGTYHVHISYLGYKCVHYPVIRIVDHNFYNVFPMHKEGYLLEGVVVQGRDESGRKRETSSSLELADQEFIGRNLHGSLIKSLETLPGISSMEIGQGFSKPAIRGLGFNRIVVVDHGIKQEGQQWGADHGLEIDQYGVESLEIIKGPASLRYGSDAIGGALVILPPLVPQHRNLQNELTLTVRSLNSMLGGSIMSRYRHNKAYYALRLTRLRYGDYRIPADSVFYNRFRLPVHNQVLKNTAGEETDFYLSVGWIDENYHSRITFSNVNSTQGFFPGSHGLPDAGRLSDDGDSRNIGLPYQHVNHLKVVSNTSVYQSKSSIELNFGFQENFRQEWSEFHTHYPTQKSPLVNPDLEIELRLYTMSAELLYRRALGKLSTQSGLSIQHQQQDIGGYMFLLPEYDRTSGGFFLMGTYRLSEHSRFEGGMRYDLGKTSVVPFYSVYAEQWKSTSIRAGFHDLSWGAGFSTDLSKNLTLKGNLGKSFRMPTAAEISANGIHHGSFRYEVGDPGITSEYAYQLDAGMLYNSSGIQLEMSPFLSWFPNYIFMEPTGSYRHPQGYEIREADAGQVYRYVQSEALRTGIDISLKAQLSQDINLYSSTEYVYASDFSYPLPFTPPLSLFSELSWKLAVSTDALPLLRLAANHTFSAAQNRNSRNEEPTPAYHVFGLSLSADIRAGKQFIQLSFYAQNLLDAKYFNHLSYYRSIELPEAGRNLQFKLRIPLSRSS